MSNARIDYLRIVRYNPSQAASEEVTTLLQTAVDMSAREHSLPGAFRVRVQKLKKNDSVRVIWNVWGWAADWAAMFMPADWWALVARADLRQELEPVSKADWERFTRQADELGALGVSCQKFKKPKAEKNDKRGVGGAGVLFASWKSDQCDTWYMRADERPAVEFRLNNRGARKFGEAVAIQMRDNPTRSAYALACCDLSSYAASWREKHLGTDDANEYVRELITMRKAEEMVLSKARALFGAMGESAAAGAVRKRRGSWIADVEAGTAEIIPAWLPDDSDLPA